MQKITIDVPIDRVPDFYQVFGSWLAGNEKTGGKNGILPPNQPRYYTWSSDDIGEAESLWSKLSLNAKSIFTILMETPDDRVAAEDLAVIAGIEKGIFGLAGALAWPSRYCYEVDRKLPISFDDTKESTVYWMEKTPADLFNAAKANEYKRKS